MGRRKKRRWIGACPGATFYKPQGVPLSSLTGMTLPLEGMEAMRLVDALGLSQEQAAERMGVSRPTLCRILGQARSRVAKALSEGMAIRISGSGAEIVAGDDASCAMGPGCEPADPQGAGSPDADGPGRGPGMGRGMGRGRGPGKGRGGRGRS